jgi:hypothetical protein
MADPIAGVGSGPAALVALYAALTYDIISATNSSPQTTEINAAARAETLMKWVNVGLAQAALFVAVGVIILYASGQAIWPPILGAGLAGVLLWAQYQHALKSGLQKGGPPTEHYG